MGTGSQTTQRLQVQRQAGGWRHFIGEEEIHCGDIIEVMQGDDWIAGRYEANLHNSLPEPKAFLELIDQRHSIKLERGMLVRWPIRD